MKFSWSTIMPCSIDFTCFAMLFSIYVTSCVVDFSNRLMLSGLHRRKYSSIFSGQQTRTISGLFLGLLKSLILFFWNTCTAWCIHSYLGQYGYQKNDDTLPDYKLLPKGKDRDLHLAWTVVQTLCTTTLSGNELVLSREFQGSKTLGKIYLGLHSHINSRHTYLER